MGGVPQAQLWRNLHFSPVEERGDLGLFRVDPLSFPTWIILGSTCVVCDEVCLHKEAGMNASLRPQPVLQSWRESELTEVSSRSVTFMLGPGSGMHCAF